jgi:hypothetical protein
VCAGIASRGAPGDEGPTRGASECTQSSSRRWGTEYRRPRRGRRPAGFGEEQRRPLAGGQESIRRRELGLSPRDPAPARPSRELARLSGVEGPSRPVEPATPEGVKLPSKPLRGSQEELTGRLRLPRSHLDGLHAGRKNMNAPVPRPAATVIRARSSGGSAACRDTKTVTRADKTFHSVNCPPTAPLDWLDSKDPDARCRARRDEATWTGQTRVDELSHFFCKGQVALTLVVGDDHWWVAGGRSPPGRGNGCAVVAAEPAKRDPSRPDRSVSRERGTSAVRGATPSRRHGREERHSSSWSRAREHGSVAAAPRAEPSTEAAPPAAPVASRNVRAQNRTTAGATDVGAAASVAAAPTGFTNRLRRPWAAGRGGRLRGRASGRHSRRKGRRLSSRAERP